MMEELDQLQHRKSVPWLRLRRERLSYFLQFRWHIELKRPKSFSSSDSLLCDCEDGCTTKRMKL